MTTTEPTIEADVPAPDPNAVNVTINGELFTQRLVKQ